MYQEFWDLKLGRIYRVRKFLLGHKYRIAWLGSPTDFDVNELGLVVKIYVQAMSTYEVGSGGPVESIEKEWATFLIGEKTLDLCRINESLPWSTYFELEQ